MEKDPAPAIGIDLGTTHSCVGVFRNGEVNMIREGDSAIIPSYAALCDGKWTIGKFAKQLVEREATKTAVRAIFSIKRIMGRKFDDSYMKDYLKNSPFPVVNKNNWPEFQTMDNDPKAYSPEEIFSEILTKMRETAEAHLKCERITEAVISVPAYFNNAQRQATHDACTIAGLKVLRIINEPTAAALAYGLQKKTADERIVMIYDFGGGTLDVEIVSIKQDFFEVLSIASNTHLGGEDFDNNMVKYFVEEFNNKHKTDLAQNKHAMFRLKLECEEAKKKLSEGGLGTINLKSLHENKDFNSSIDRNKFEDLNKGLFDIILEPVENCLRGANYMDKAQIHEVVMVGGSTRIPKVRELLQKFFEGTNCKLQNLINPEEAVAYGAAVQAAKLNGANELRDLVLMDIIPFSLSVNGGVPTASEAHDEIDGKGSITRIPTRRSIKFPIQSAQPVPDAHKQRIKFPIQSDKQILSVDVYETESAEAKLENAGFLLTFPSPGKSLDEIEVTYDINANGILDKVSVFGIKKTLPEPTPIVNRLYKSLELYRSDLFTSKLDQAKNQLEAAVQRSKSKAGGKPRDDVAATTDQRIAAEQKYIGTMKKFIKDSCDILELNTFANVKVSHNHRKTISEKYEKFKKLVYSSADTINQGRFKMEKDRLLLEGLLNTVVELAKCEKPEKRKNVYRSALKVEAEACKEEIKEGFREFVRTYDSDKFEEGLDKEICVLMQRMAIKAKHALLSHNRPEE